MNMEEEIFKRSKVNTSKLLDYGFKKLDDKYVYEKEFLRFFKAIISVDDNSKVKGRVIDLKIDDEYTNFRIEGELGSFASKIKDEYLNILNDIKEKCFDNNYFIFSQTNRITKYIKDKYKVEPEFLWEDTPGCGVFKNQDNHKWFGIIMNLDKSKIIENKSGEIEVLNVKLDKETDEYLKVKGIYPAYHMNKKNWVTIILDDTLIDNDIINLIDKSYMLVNKK